MDSVKLGALAGVHGQQRAFNRPKIWISLQNTNNTALECSQTEARREPADYGLHQSRSSLSRRPSRSSSRLALSVATMVAVLKPRMRHTTQNTQYTCVPMRSWPLLPP